MVRKITEALDELFAFQGISLAESLRIIAARNENGRRHEGRMQKTARFLLDSLSDGNLFSNSLRECPYVRFDAVYLSFVMLAEKSGNLSETISFLRRRCERTYQSRSKLVEASVYPVFVMIVSAAAGGLLLEYTETKVGAGLIGASLFLLVLCWIVLFILWACLREDKLTDAFYALDFLVKSGSSISAAVECAAHIVGVNSQTGAVLLEAKSKLEYGLSLREALLLKGRMAEILYFADKGGSQNELFNRLARWQEERFIRRRRLCLNLVEPLFICIAGCFLLILVVYIFMPYMNDLSWL